MNDDQLNRLFGSLDQPAEPDLGFAASLFDRLEHERRAQRHHLPVRWLLLAAALLVATAIGTALLAGSGRLRLPIVLVPSTERPSPPHGDAPFHLAYIADGDVFLADSDGTSAVRVADGGNGGCGGDSGYGVEGQMWSPDGRYLAYRGGWCGDDTTGTVYVRDASGAAVTSFPGEGWQVRWSPDSNRIATWDGFTRAVAVYTLDGELEAHLTLPAEITDEWLLGDYDPVWSPDGTSLLFPPFEVPVDGTAIRLPEGHPLSFYGAVPSPDGSQVAYIGEGGELAIANIDGSGARTLVESGARGRPSTFGLLWSPAADKVAFGNTTGSGGGLGDELQILDLDTGSIVIVPVSGENVYPMRFSPDGDQVLFLSGGQGLWSVDTDGSNPKFLVEGYGDWQPATPSGD